MSMHATRLFLVMVALTLVSVPCSAQDDCGNPDADPWVKDLYERLTSFDELSRYAIERYGPPKACTGMVTSTFHGSAFGSVRLDFGPGVSFEVETFPPESSLATLADSSGFDDEDKIRAVLKSYAAKIGLSIDWSASELSLDGEDRIETYWDRDDEMNASARLVYSGDTLISVHLGLAL